MRYVNQTVDATRTAPHWPLVAVVGGAVAVLASYVPPSWYGQRTVGSNIGAGFLWVLGMAAMVTGTVAVIRSLAKPGGRSSRRWSQIVCAACWIITAAAFVVGIVIYRA